MEKEEEGRILEKDETVLKNMRSLSKTDNHGVKMSDMKFLKPLQRRERNGCREREKKKGTRKGWRKWDDDTGLTCDEYEGGKGYIEKMYSIMAKYI